MNVLVTGGTGFLGAYVIAALEAAGHAPLAYDIAPPSRDCSRSHPSCPRASARARSATSHACSRSAAARRSRRSSMRPAWSGWSSRWRSRSRPIRPTSWGWCMPARRRASSACASWSRSPAMPPITRARASSLVETDPPFSVTAGNPAAHYGTSKMAGEAIGIAYASFQEVDFLALRITAIYGFGMRSPMYIKPMVENAVRGAADALCDRRADEARLHPCARLRRRDPAGAERAAARARGAQRVLNVAAGRACTAAEVAADGAQHHPGRRDRDRRHADAARSRERQDARAARHLGGEARARLVAEMAARRWHPAIRRTLPAVSRRST